MTDEADPYGKIVDQDELYSSVPDDDPEWSENWREWSIRQESETETYDL